MQKNSSNIDGYVLKMEVVDSWFFLKIDSFHHNFNIELKTRVGQGPSTLSNFSSIEFSITSFSMTG